MAEAVAFGILQGLHLQPKIHDKVDQGGPDFLCMGSVLSCGMRNLIKPTSADNFVVEATSLNPDAVERQSGIPNALDDLSGGFFRLLSKAICNKAKDKRKQLAHSAMPRVLAIASGHNGIAALFNSGGAALALLDLKNSVFIKLSNDKTQILPCRQEISAILLIAIYRDKSEVYGLLHPAPQYPFDIRFFPKVPFIRITNWPLADEMISPKWVPSTEWVISEPDPYNACHWAIEDPKTESG